MFGVPYFQHQWIITFCARFGYAIKKYWKASTRAFIVCHLDFIFFWLVVAAVIFNARRLYVMHLKCLTTYAAFQITFISDRVYLSTHIHPCYAHLYTIHVKFCQRIIICVGFVSYFSHFFRPFSHFGSILFLVESIYLFLIAFVFAFVDVPASKRTNEQTTKECIHLPWKLQSNGQKVRTKKINGNGNVVNDDEFWRLFIYILTGHFVRFRFNINTK